MVYRSNNNANANGGVSYANANNDSANVNSSIGSRLANNSKDIRFLAYGKDGESIKAEPMGMHLSNSGNGKLEKKVCGRVK